MLKRASKDSIGDLEKSMLMNFGSLFWLGCKILVIKNPELKQGVRAPYTQGDENYRTHRTHFPGFVIDQSKLDKLEGTVVSQFPGDE